MLEKSARGRICHCIYGYVKANNKYMKDYDKNKESSYLQYWDVNNFGWAMSPVNSFEWIKDTSQFMKISQKTIMKKVMKDIFLKFMFNILKNYMNFITIYHFYQKE